MQSFVNREAELDRLRECYDSPRGELIVVYGRRRMGKTELIRHSLAGRDNVVHFQATETTKRLQLEDFVARAAETFPDIVNVRPDWEPLIQHLAQQGAIIVLDEFPYLVQAYPPIASILQRLWDLTVQHSKATIILVGSSIGMMEEKVLSGAAPLHGRATMRCEARQLGFRHVQTFFPTYTPEQAVQTWSIYGGTPHYLQTIKPHTGLPQNVFDSILSNQGILHDEPEFALRTELHEPKTYFSILKAIARGHTTPNTIAQASGLERERISYYLKTLQTLWIVQREIPVTENPLRSRQGRYRLRDPFFRFWFDFVYGQGDKYEEIGPKAFDALIAPHLADHTSEAFERLCQESIQRLYPDDLFNRIGRWWFKEQEIDIVGVTTGRTMLVGECKFTKEPVGPKILHSIEHKAHEVRWTPQKGGQPAILYAIFSKGGFTPALEAVACERDDLRLFTLDQVVTALRHPHEASR